MDREKAIKELTDIGGWIAGRVGFEQAKNFLHTIDDAVALIKEQEDLGTELTNAVELIHKKNERIEKLLKEQEVQKFFVDESGKITPLPVVVRCKDCKHIQSDGWCKYYRHSGNEDWFCADGERKEVTE